MKLFSSRPPMRQFPLSQCFALLLAAAPLPVSAAVSATLSWTASPDASVTGYNIYYGNASQHYTNSIAVGQVTNAIIPGLQENTTYFFAAKSHDAAGNESDFSNVAAFAGFVADPDAALHLKVVTNFFSGAPLNFSLGASAPAGVTINSTNGMVSWTPSRADACTTNYITVTIADASNPDASISETLMVVVGGYLEFEPGQSAVVSGQTGSLPLTIASSSGVTNVEAVLGWPDEQLLNPTLAFTAPIVAGSLQHLDHQLVVRLQTALGVSLTGTNQVAQVNFQAANGQASTVYKIPAAAASGVTTAGTAYTNVLAPPGEVVVVGNQPLLRPAPTTGSGRALSLYAIPGNYQLLYATSLVPPVTWTPLTTYQQTNAAQMVELDATAPVIFYRLQQL